MPRNLADVGFSRCYNIHLTKKVSFSPKNLVGILECMVSISLRSLNSFTYVISKPYWCTMCVHASSKSDSSLFLQYKNKSYKLGCGENGH